MKKKLYTMLCLLLALALPLAAFAQEEAEMDLLLEGFVTEIVDGGFVMEDEERGEILLNTSEATVWDGMLAEGELEIGQYVMVQFDGTMTFSLPPQAHADSVGAHSLAGSITEVYEDGVILMNDATHGDVLVHVDETLPLYAGMPITVWYDGVMTLSLPGQVSARHIILPELTGTVSQWTEESFLLTDADGNEYEVLMNEETKVALMPEEMTEEEEITGEEASEETPLTEETADGEAMTEEAESSEEETAGEETSEEMTEETTEESTGESIEETAVEWGDESLVTVYYNGMMTRSIPAQLTALEIRVME